MRVREVKCTNPACRATNRVADYAIDRMPVCGICKRPLPEPSGVRWRRRFSGLAFRLLSAFLFFHVIACFVGLIALTTTLKANDLVIFTICAVLFWEAIEFGGPLASKIASALMPKTARRLRHDWPDLFFVSRFLLRSMKRPTGRLGALLIKHRLISTGGVASLGVLAWIFWPNPVFQLPPGVGVAVARPAAIGPSPDGKTPTELYGLPFDISPDGVPVVAFENDFWALGPGTAERLETIVPESTTMQPSDAPPGFRVDAGLQVDDFAWAGDGALLLVGTLLYRGAIRAETYVYVFGKNGARRLSDSKIPSYSNTRLAIRPAGPRAVYVYGDAPSSDGKNPNYGKSPTYISNVYLVRNDGKVATLAQFDRKISAVTGDGQVTYVASGQLIYQVRSDGGSGPAAFLETGCDVISLARDDTGAVFYSTTCAVGYVDQAGRAYEFLRGKGGQVRVRGSSLYLLLQDEPIVLRFEPVSAFGQLAR